jgi:hypothetical protein
MYEKELDFGYNNASCYLCKNKRKKPSFAEKTRFRGFQPRYYLQFDQQEE